jgi:hypothetical protein
LRENEFMDKTFEEFSALYTGFQAPKSSQIKHLLGTESVAESIDWREKNAVSEVKNQGQCGSCWAFSAIGALEGLNAIKNSKLVEFSEQALVDCSKNGNQGCNGGLMDQAFDWVKDNGIPTEDSYKYTGRDGTCKKFDSAFKVAGFTDVPKSSPEQMKLALNSQPVAVGIHANFRFQFYGGGVMDFSCKG